jgi:hypothetical protein
MADQEAKVRRMLKEAVRQLNVTLRFQSVHAAVLQPHRLGRWLEGAAKLLPEEDCASVSWLTSVLVLEQRPPADQFTRENAPGHVPKAQWREGAAQLQREVSHCL